MRAGNQMIFGIECEVMKNKVGVMSSLWVEYNA